MKKVNYQLIRYKRMIKYYIFIIIFTFSFIFISLLNINEIGISLFKFIFIASMVLLLIGVDNVCKLRHIIRSLEEEEKYELRR